MLIGQPADQAKFIEQDYTNISIHELQMGCLRIIRTEEGSMVQVRRRNDGSGIRVYPPGK